MASGNTDGWDGSALNHQLQIGRTAATREVLETELLRLLLVGFTLKEAAQNMRASYWTVRKLAREPAFLLKVKEHSAEIADRMTQEVANNIVDFAKKLEEASEKALEEMINLVDKAPTPGLKYKVCQDLLDRDSRSSRTKRIEQNTKHEFINPAVLLHAAATARELERATAVKSELPPASEGSPDVDPAA